MFELTIQREFCAAHGIMLRGEREPLHGHNWVVVVTVAGDSLDDDGLLCDFHALERRLERIIEPFQNRNLNETPPFDRLNPSAEHVARHIADSLGGNLPSGARLVSVSVAEAPNCIATYRL